MAVFRIPIVLPDGSLPSIVRIKEASLPSYLAQSNVATKAELAAIGGVTLAQVQNLINISRAELLAQVEELVAGLGGGRVFVQESPITTVDIEHALGRSVVSVTVFSLDFSFMWEGFDVFPLSDDRVRLSFDDPITFVALIL